MSETGRFFVYPVRDKTPKASDGCQWQPISNGVYAEPAECVYTKFVEVACPEFIEGVE